MAKTLVLYFSATNTTKKVANKVAQKLNADIAEIHPATAYTTADLDWNDSNSRTTVEQHDHDSRVAIKDDLPDINNYDNIIIGHPIWWQIPPRLISTTIDKLDLNGKNFATFGTSSDSDYQRAQTNIERTVKENHYELNLKQGAVLNNDRQIDDWLKQINFN